MADAPKRKPAARKPVKRGPTKAAALKALGLTPEDLEAIKALREAKTNDAAVDAAESLAGHPLKRSEVHEATANLKPAPGFGGLGGDDPQKALEERPAPAKREWNAPDPDADPVWYVRNLRGVDVSFRLSRQKDHSNPKDRIALKPRGARGDMVKLESGDLKDPELQTQVSFDLVEVIPEGEALEAIKKQFTNQQTVVPAHIAALRNPLGKEYAQANPVKFATDEEAYGIKVADLDPDLMKGNLSDREIKRGGGFVQNAQHTPVGGNPAIISDGFMAAAQTDSSQMGNNDQRSQDIDALARSKQFEGPGAGLGSVTVKVEPVQRVQ